MSQSWLPFWLNYVIHTLSGLSLNILLNFLPGSPSQAEPTAHSWAGPFPLWGLVSVLTREQPSRPTVQSVASLSRNSGWIVNKATCISLGKVCLGECFLYLNKAFISKWIAGMSVSVVFLRSHLTNFGSPSGNVVLLGGCVIIASVIIARVSSLVLIVCLWI